VTESLETYYGLPAEVRFCTCCVMSNQRPASYPEFKHQKDRKAPTLHIDADGVCDACRYAEKKEQIDWEAREAELHRLLDRFRRHDGGYDCICPGSGGKDSVYAAHLLKYQYGMHPLTVTWPPILYTDYGLANFRRWIEQGGFDNISFKPNGRVQRLLTRLGIENLLHPFQTFILGQKNVAPKIALKYKIPLIFYGESEAEYGNPIAETNTSLRDKSYYSMQHLNEVYLAGVAVPELMEKYAIALNDLTPYFPADYQELEDGQIEVHYLGYYKKWTPQEAYYYAVENTGFEANPVRTEGTYSKYNSLDDKVDGFFYFTRWIKFGVGRAMMDSAQEIRNHHITKDEAIALMKRYEGEYPARYEKEFLEYISMTRDELLALCDRFRSPHLWKVEAGEWKLRRTPWSQDGRPA